MDIRAGTGRRRCILATLALVLACQALPCAAQVGPLTYQNLFFNQASNAQSGNYLAADAGLIYTNNATFSTSATSDTLAEIGLVGNSAYQGPRFDYHLDSDIAAVKYLHDTYRFEPTGYFDAGADFKVVPGLFSWFGRETYSQLVINPYAPVTPDNLENLNNLTTGPRFILQPTLRTTVTLQGSYSYIDTHSSSPLYVNIDSHRYAGNLRIEHALSNTASFYLTGDYQKMVFTDVLMNNNFTVAEGSAGYKVNTERTLLDISGGYTQLRELDVLVPVETIVGTVQRPMTRTLHFPNWSVTLSRVLTPRQRLELTASQQLLDASTLFQSDLNQAVPTIAPGQAAVGSPLTNRVFALDWRLQGPRTSLDIALVDTEQHYQFASGDNRNLKDASALVARQLGPTLNWDVGVHFERQDLSSARAVNATTEITDLRWRAGLRIGLRAFFAHSTFAGISDNQVGVLVSYTLIGVGAGAAPSLEPVAPYELEPVSPLSTLPPTH